MADRLPMGLGPLMGLMLWRMQRGDTPAQAREAAEHHPDYQGFTPDEYTTAMRAAQRNMAATKMAEQLPDTARIGSCYHCGGNTSDHS